MKYKLLAVALIGGIVAAAAIAPAVLAAAKGSDGPAFTAGRTAFHQSGEGHELHKGELFQQIADVLGISVDDLHARLRGGETLGQVAGDKSDEVRALVAQNLTAHIDEALSTGRISDARAAELRANLDTKVDGILDGTGFHAGGHHGGFRHGPGGGCDKEGSEGTSQDTTTKVEA